MQTTQWYSGYKPLNGSDDVLEGSDYPFVMLDFKSMQDKATDEAQELLAKAEYFRLEGKPEKWARDIERKALKKLERSFELREGLLSSHKFPLPEFLPSSSYSNDPKRKAMRSDHA